MELITVSGRRFFKKDGMFHSGDHKMRLTPKQFKQWVMTYGGGQVMPAKQWPERFVNIARLKDKLGGADLWQS